VVLVHARADAARQAGRAVGNGVELVDDIIHELESAGVGR